MGAYGGPRACSWNNPGIEVNQTLDYQVESLVAPESIELNQNYPNPFNPSTTVSFFIEKESQVTLSVYNVLGEEVATILSDRVEPGSHQITWDAGNLAGGIYLMRLETPQAIKTKKMILMK
jgi:flagellar hook assembly protein FlgD